MATSTTVGNLACVDDATATLLLQLQLEDLEELLRSIRENGESPQGVVSDVEVALQLEKEELERNITMIADRQMSRSMARAVIADAQALTLATRQETLEIADRAFALRLGGVAPPQALPTPPAAPSTTDAGENDFIDKLSAIYVETPAEDASLSTALVKYDPTTAAAANSTSTPDTLVVYNPDVDISHGESSPEASGPIIKVDKRVCVICMDDVVFYQVARLSCGHECCQDCLTDIFASAIRNESRYPPQCCEVIRPHTKEIQILLTSDLIQEFEKKKIEWETKDRTYCHRRNCQRFIPTRYIIADKARCPACQYTTCTMCKDALHNGDCPADEGLQQALELMKENGWRRCSRCHSGVELHFGCNHMTCTCKNEFCYVCEVKWKECLCAQWDEDRLLIRANVIAGRHGMRLDQAAHWLRTQGDCAHQGGFRHVDTPAICENCGDCMPIYIKECGTCLLRVCLFCSTMPGFAEHARHRQERRERREQRERRGR